MVGLESRALSASASSKNSPLDMGLAHTDLTG